MAHIRIDIDGETKFDEDVTRYEYKVHAPTPPGRTPTRPPSIELSATLTEATP